MRAAAGRRGIPDALRRRKGEVRSALMRSLEINARGPRTLLHQYVHPGNRALDVAYALSSGLDVGDRRSWERKLLAGYLDELAAAGGKPPGFDAAWLA